MNKLPNQPISHHFTDVLDPNEHILWSGKPVFIPFIASGIPFFLFGLLWGFIDYGFIQSALSGNITSQPSGLTLIPFFLLHLMPLWLGTFNMLRLFFIYSNTSYIFTNKRIILRSGFWGIDYKSVDYDKLENVDVKVSPIDHMFGVGNILLNTGIVGSRGTIAYDTLLAISDPYRAFKRLKTLTVDVKTDWNYPNKLRPAENQGYQTSYTDPSAKK